MTEPKRNLSVEEEQAIRACHHDFDGLTQVEAAKKLGIPQSRLSERLKSAKKKAPQLFPIYTKAQYRVKQLLDKNSKIEAIAVVLGIGTGRVDDIIESLYAKGYTRPSHKVIQYQEFMDDEVKEKF